MTKLLGLLLALSMLASCAPTVRQAGTEVVLKPEGKTLLLLATSPISYGYGAVLGKVSSRYCAGEVSEKPRACPQLASGWTKLDIPPGEYPQRLVVGTMQGAPADGFFDVALSGARVTYRAELQR